MIIGRVNFTAVTPRVPSISNTIVLNQDVLVTFLIAVTECLAKAN